jgi:hypothetical protein
MSSRSRPVALLVWFALVASAPAAGQEPVKLFKGKDLSGWTIFLPKGEDGDTKSDPKGVFKVEEGILHVSGEQFGYIITNDEFENYRLVIEFKWGEKRYPPREQAKRDSGVLFHCVGPDKVWPRSIECQIQEGDCGDFWMVDATELTVAGKRVAGGRAIKTRDAEKPNGEWNTIEVDCDGGKITNIVNGVVVNEGTDASVTKGKILLQSEGAEIFFRRVDLYPNK